MQDWKRKRKKIEKGEKEKEKEEECRYYLSVVCTSVYGDCTKWLYNGKHPLLIVINN